MAMFPTRDEVRTFFKGIPPAVYGGIALAGAYLLSGPAKNLAGKIGESPISEKFSGAFSPDPLLGIGMGISALAGGRDKPITAGLYGLGVSSLDDLARLFGSDMSYGFSEFSGDMLREGGIMVAAYLAGRSARWLKGRLLENRV